MFSLQGVEWTVVLVLITLVGGIASIIKLIVPLVKSLTTLTDSTETLKNSVESVANNNNQAHHRLWEEVNGQGKVIAEHETRITVVEHKVK